VEGDRYQLERSSRRCADGGRVPIGNMFYDLNVAWSASDSQLPRTLAFLDELGYNVVALNHTISGKLPTTLVWRVAGHLEK
jgi:hypothetical protein